MSAVLEISFRAYAEIRAKMAVSGLVKNFRDDPDHGGEVIDMDGVTLKARKPEPGPFRKEREAA